MIEAYSSLKETRGTQPGRRLDVLLRLADLDMALDTLPHDLWEVVLLHGLIGIPQDETARLLQTSQRSVSRRYRQGIEHAHYFINGGT